MFIGHVDAGKSTIGGQIMYQVHVEIVFSNIDDLDWNGGQKNTGKVRERCKRKRA